MGSVRQLPSRPSQAAPESGACAHAKALPVSPKQVNTSRDLRTYRDLVKYPGPLTGTECLASAILLAHSRWVEVDGEDGKPKRLECRISGVTIPQLITGILPNELKQAIDESSAEECPRKIAKMTFLRSMDVLSHPALPDGQRFITRIVKPSSGRPKNDINDYIFHHEAYDYWAGRPALPEPVRPQKKPRPRPPKKFDKPWGEAVACMGAGPDGSPDGGQSPIRGTTDVDVSEIAQEFRGTTVVPREAVQLTACRDNPPRMTEAVLQDGKVLVIGSVNTCAPPAPAKKRRRPLEVSLIHQSKSFRDATPALAAVADTHFAGDQGAAAAAAVVHYAEHLRTARAPGLSAHPAAPPHGPAPAVPAPAAPPTPPAAEDDPVDPDADERRAALAAWILALLRHTPLLERLATYEHAKELTHSAYLVAKKRGTAEPDRAQLREALGRFAEKVDEGTYGCDIAAARAFVRDQLPSVHEPLPGLPPPPPYVPRPEDEPTPLDLATMRDDLARLRAESDAIDQERTRELGNHGAGVDARREAGRAELGREQARAKAAIADVDPEGLAARQRFDEAAAYARARDAALFDRLFAHVQYDGVASGVLHLTAEDEGFGDAAHEHFGDRIAEKLDELGEGLVEIAWSLGPIVRPVVPSVVPVPVLPPALLKQ